MAEQLYKVIMRCLACKCIIAESDVLDRDEMEELRKHNTLAKFCFRCNIKAKPSTISVTA